MSAVYGAEHVHMHKPFAVKVLNPEMSRSPEAVTRFQREAVAASRIEHPNIAAATDFGSLDDGSFFLVLELVEGKTLREAIAAGPMPPTRVLHIARQIADGLARAHAQDIVHRDLKPENVMLTKRDDDVDFVKLLDFGIAKIPPKELPPTSEGAAPLTQVGMVYGTPEYMAPEQAMGKPVDARADLYALGVIIFEMLVGRRPWDDANKVVLLGKHISEPVPPMPGVPPPLEAIVRKLMEKQAGDRYAKADDVVAAIDAIPPSDASFVPQVKTLPLSAVQAPKQPEQAGELMRVVNHLLDRIPLALPQRKKLWLVLGAAAFVLLLALSAFVAVVVHFTHEEPGRSSSSKSATDHRARCLSAAASGDHEGVIREATAWAADNASADSDDEVARAVGAEVGHQADAAFDLLEHKLGRAGADILYDLAWGPAAAGDPTSATRAKHALQDDGVKSHMSPALAVTVGIRTTSDACAAKTKYFVEAAKVGDARTLDALAPLLKRGGCGRHGRVDCHPCLRSGDDSVDKTAAAIRARVSDGGAASGG
jgi:hypothetical protein